MPENGEKISFVKEKRLVLVVDDELVNRELLKLTLEQDYEVILAGDGEEALKKCEAYKDTLSLVLLDLMMPVLPGLEVLRRMKENPEFSSIPVIVVTADQGAEIESLNLGAVDFIPKPYPQAGVILARVRRTIELYEDREIISGTERDPLTGLYNKEFFYRYAEQFDHHHPNLETDAIVIDVNHFHMINERFGSSYGDEVLRRIGEKVREMVRDSGGIVCRREADTFLVYCPSRKDYAAILENASVDLAREGSPNANRVRLRMGVYTGVDKSLGIERRFDRAKLAADAVKGSFAKPINFYDNALHEKELYAEQLVEEFHKAIQERQFKVYYQPKFDIRPAVPVLASAEALVRWQHPTFGLISPGVFIPLFEANGLVQDLDTYVWEETARQIREWRDRLGFAVPVSVNVSRIDMYNPDLVPVFQNIIRRNGIGYEDLLLEVTESAYTQDSQQIVQTAARLRKLGFRIEMDDFGTGYSSLNIISSLPIDALKLDMQFVRTAFGDKRDTRMLEAIIDIASRLSVPVIAEGVETQEQLNTLRALCCDIAQGYYFSRPLPAEDFEEFLRAARDGAAVSAQEPAPERPSEGAGESEAENEHISFFEKAMAAEEERIVREEAEAARSAAPEPTRGGSQLKTMSIFFAVISVLAAVALFLSDVSVNNSYRRMVRASNRYITSQIAASNMEAGSNYLSDRVRCFVITGEVEYLQDFFEEVEITKRRDLALDELEMLLEDKENSAYKSLEAALFLSNELVDREYLAMRLMLETGDYRAEDIPDAIRKIELSPEDLALTPEEQKEKARALVFDHTYMHYKERIHESISLCTQELIRSSSVELANASARMSWFVRAQTAMTIFFLLIVLLIIAIINAKVRRPLAQMIDKMRSQQAVEPAGLEDMQFAMRMYNAILRENRASRERLRHEASYDPLTGVLNRGAYELMLKHVDTLHMALILVDVDYFKMFNDTYGHDVGDKVLKRVAEVLKASFRSVDVICRIGGDEFVVMMTRADSSMRDLVVRKITRANEVLQHPNDDLPPVSLSVGVAFSDRKNPRGDIFKDADTALYRVKEAGHNGCEVY